jgi:urea carboxylase
MEGPGGYQFVGRTLQMWNRYQKTVEFRRPWLLRFFDQIQFYEVSHEELIQIRRDFPSGDYPLKIEDTTFSLGDYERFLEANSDSINQFSSVRRQAFEHELAQWHANGQFHYQAEEAEPVIEEQEWPEFAFKIDSPVSGSVWELSVNEGDQVELGQTLMILESMKMEIPLVAAQAGQVIGLPVACGARIQAGQTLCVLSGGEHE